MRECVGKSAMKMLAKVDASLMLRLEERLKAELVDEDAPIVLKRVSRMQPQPTRQVSYKNTLIFVINDDHEIFTRLAEMTNGFCHYLTKYVNKKYINNCHITISC